MNFIKKNINELRYADYINKDNTIIGGHQRVTVLKYLGYEEINVIQIDIDKTKEKALNIALNKITGSWDYALLGDLLLELDAENYDLEITGFDLNEIEDLMAPIDWANVDDLTEEKLSEIEEILTNFGVSMEEAENFTLVLPTLSEISINWIENGINIATENGLTINEEYHLSNINLSLIMLFLILYIIKSGSHLNR